MPNDRWHSRVDAVRTQWRTLERDWQSVVVGAMIVFLVVVFQIQVPW